MTQVSRPRPSQIRRSGVGPRTGTRGSSPDNSTDTRLEAHSPASIVHSFTYTWDACGQEQTQGTAPQQNRITAQSASLPCPVCLRVWVGRRDAPGTHDPLWRHCPLAGWRSRLARRTAQPSGSAPHFPLSTLTSITAQRGPAQLLRDKLWLCLLRTLSRYVLPPCPFLELSTSGISPVPRGN